MLGKLEVPVVATGPAQIDARLKDAGERTQLDFNAKAGDFTVSTNGTLKSLSLVGADLTLKIEHTEIGSRAEDTQTSGHRHRADADRHPNQGCRRAPAAGLQGKARRYRRQRERHAQDARPGGSDLKFEATAADAARLASVFDVKRCARNAAQGLGTHRVYRAKRSSLKR